MTVSFMTALKSLGVTESCMLTDEPTNAAELAEFYLSGSEVDSTNSVVMTTGGCPHTYDAIIAEQVRLQGIEDANQYKTDRASEYPSIGDQLDALFHAGVFPEEMAATIQAVKDAYPKPE